MNKYDYDVIVLGAGSGGISSANLAHALGKKTALVEKGRIGGDCTWYGCIPSKTLIRAAKAAHDVSRLAEFGLSLKGDATVDASGVLEHVRAVRAGVYEGEKPEVFEARGIDVLIGDTRFVDPHTVSVGDRTVTSEKFILATGSKPFVPPIEGIADVPFDTNESLYERETAPMVMAVLGGGPIGVEMAAALNRLGTRVTVIQKAPRILPFDDEELVEILTEHLAGEGVEFLLNCEAVGVARAGDGIALSLKKPDGEVVTKQIDCLFVALGRRPNVAELALEKAGIEYSPRGVVVDDTLRTSAHHIYAVGDITGGFQFSHIAEYHANIAVPNAVLPLPIKRKIDENKVVWATFTDPELAHAGLTEKVAREKHGGGVRVYRYPYEKIDRAVTDRATVGMAKFITDRHGLLVGIHILGEHASDLLHEAQLARILEVPFHRIQEVVHIYPTYGDLVKRPSNAAYADHMGDNPIARIARKLAGS